MRRNIGSFGLIMSILVLFASCLGDSNTDVTLYSDAAITSFNITTAKIYREAKSPTTGNDTTYITTNSSMSAYTFDIDHAKGLIYNTDSLPVGTDATKLLCDYSSKNNGVVVIKSIGSDSIRYLQTTDTTDFSQPRTLYVYSSDGTSMRNYTVDVRVHKEYADSFHWNRLPDNAEIAALKGAKAFAMGGRIVLLGSDGTQTRAYSTASGDGTAWAATGAVFGADAYNSAATKGDTLYIMDGDMLKASVDGSVFFDIAAASGMRLLGATTTEMYAMDDEGSIMVSADGGLTWAADSIDDSQRLMPTADLAFCRTSLSRSDSTDYALLVGNRDTEAFPADANAMVWSKTVEYSQVREQRPWTSVSGDNDGYYMLPRLASLNVFAYNGSIIAFGGAGKGACQAGAYSRFYVSADGGITWKRNSSYKMPGELDTTATAVASAVSADGYIWMICTGTGQVWRGRINKMGWQN